MIEQLTGDKLDRARVEEAQRLWRIAFQSDLPHQGIGVAIVVSAAALAVCQCLTDIAKAIRERKP